MALTDIDRIFHPNTTEYTFFSVPHGTFSTIDHITGHKSSLKRYKKFTMDKSWTSATTETIESIPTHGN